MSSMAVPGNDELETRALSIPEQAKQIRVLDQTSYERACAFLRDTVAAMRREIEETFDPICRKMFEAHKEATAQRRRHLEPIEQAERVLKQAIGSYDLEQRRIREEAGRRMREEQEALLAEALESVIETAEAEGASVEEIRAIVEQPIAAPRPAAPYSAPQVKGVITSKTWKVEITDIRKLAKAVGEGKCASNLVSGNEAALNALARAQGPEIMRFVPGIRVVEVSRVATRR